MFQTEILEKLKTHFMCNKLFIEYCAVQDKAEKYWTTEQATDDNIRTRIACWIRKATNTHSGYVILIAFPSQQWLCTKAPQCYVIRILPIWLFLKLHFISTGWHKHDRISWVPVRTALRRTDGHRGVSVLSAKQSRQSFVIATCCRFIVLLITSVCNN